MTKTLSDLLMDQMAYEIQKEIDEEIVNGFIRDDVMLKGWTQAPFTTDKFSWPFEYKLDEVAAWVHIHASDEYKFFGKEIWFKSKQDLTAFILKWG
jgi:hypothetical protein